MTRDTRPSQHIPKSNTALAVAIKRNDWDLAALLLLEALASVAQRLPPGTIDDVLALISDAEAHDDARR